MGAGGSGATWDWAAAVVVAAPAGQLTPAFQVMKQQQQPSGHKQCNTGMFQADMTAEPAAADHCM
jgi:hypothetical protein